jgi:CBS domain containing-hemolysin-like protein
MEYGMKDFIVKDLMVPISEYASVPLGSTLAQAVLALEQAQEKYTHTQYSHRAVLVMDKHQHVVGKISQLDFLHSIEKQDEQTERIKNIAKYGFSPKAIAFRQERYGMKSRPGKDIYTKAAILKVDDFMQRPTEGEYVEENHSLETAVHQLITGRHLSLLVTREKKIVGILRLSDVFAAVFHTMKKFQAFT